MTKKDYERIAAALNRAWYAVNAGCVPPHTPPAAEDGTEAMGVYLATHMIAEALGRENVQFDPKRFIAATGVR